MCRQEVKKRLARPHLTIASSIVSSFGFCALRYAILTVRDECDSRAAGQYHLIPRPAPPPILTRFFSDDVHAREEESPLNREAAFGSHSRRDSPAYRSRVAASSLSDFLTCTSTRGSIWRATDCSRVPGDPVYNSGRSRPCRCRAARSQSRPSRFSPRDETHRGAGPSQVSFNPPCSKLFICRFIYSLLTLIRPRTHWFAIRWLTFELYWLTRQ